MTKHMTFPKVRGIKSARADAAPMEILNELKRTFEEMKAKLETDSKDVVRTEEVNRINAEISNLQKALADANRLMASVTLGGGSGDPLQAEAAAHGTAFARYFRRGEEAGLRDLEAKAELSTLSDPDGGYLVPRRTATAIDDVVRDMSVMRELATVLDIDSMEYRKFVNLGGSGSGWIGEKETRPNTGTPELAEIIINMMELYANPMTTQRLLDTAIINVEAWLAGEVAQEFAEQEGAAFVSGNGIKKPKGILDYDIVANGSYQWGKVGYVPSGAAGGFKVADKATGWSPEDALINLKYALKSRYRAGAVFLMNDMTQAEVRKLKDADGINLWRPPVGPEDVPSILGSPIRTDDFMPDIGANQYSIAYGNFARAYLIVQMPTIRVLRDALTLKGKVQFYTTKYVGGGIQHFEAVKLMKFAAS